VRILCGFGEKVDEIVDALKAFGSFLGDGLGLGILHLRRERGGRSGVVFVAYHEIYSHNLGGGTIKEAKEEGERERQREGCFVLCC